MLLSLALALLQDSPTWTDEAVLRSERVVLGTVEKVYGAPTRKLHLVLVRVNETLVGAHEDQALVLVPGVQPGKAALEVGGVALLFLVELRPAEIGQPHIARVLEYAPRLRPWSVVEEDLRRVEGCDWLVPEGFRCTLVEQRVEIGLASLRQELGQSCARVFPRLRAGVDGLDVVGWRIEGAPRGPWLLNGRPEPVDPDDEAMLWSSLRSLESLTSPRTVGASPRDYGLVFWIELRDARGVHRIESRGAQLPATATREEREGLELFARLWKLLPGERKPPHAQL